MSKYGKGKKNTCSDSQRHFATRKIKVECGKAWGLCALGLEEVHWAYIYSKARTAWGFVQPWQHWGIWPDPNSLLFTSNNHIPFANNLHLKCASPLCLAGEKQNPTFLHCTHRASILVTFPCTKTKSDFPHPFQWACGNRLTKQLLFTISKYCSVWHKSRELFCFWWIYLVSWLQTSLGERCDFYLTCCGSFVLLNTGPWHKRGFAVTLFA